jgi:hypothetical protein
MFMSERPTTTQNEGDTKAKHGETTTNLPSQTEQQAELEHHAQ